MRRQTEQRRILATLEPRRINPIARLPHPALARSGTIPTGDYAYEVKWDGFRAIGSEVAWKGDGHTGIVAIRDDCGGSEKMYIKITHRLE